VSESGASSEGVAKPSKHVSKDPVKRAAQLANLQPKQPAPDLPASDGDGPGLLEVMKHVLHKKASSDTLQVHTEIRGWLKDDRKGFMNKLVDLEGKVAAKAVNQPAEPETDENTQRILAKIEQLLREKPWNK
jgi:uncharacterized protein (DUF2345 family)